MVKAPVPPSPAASVPPSVLGAGTGAAFNVTPLPVPAANLTLTKIPLPKGYRFHRIHSNAYASTEYNPGAGNARFSPIKDGHGKSIPTMYAGSDFDCAAMETIFHNVPYSSGPKFVPRDLLADRVYSVLTSTDELKLVDLSAIALRNTPITRKELIESGRIQYPETRRWAEAIHRQCVWAQGLHWVSQQHDGAIAVVLFEDRITTGTLQELIAPTSLFHAKNYDNVMTLAEKIGVMLTAT